MLHGLSASRCTRPCPCRCVLGAIMAAVYRQFVRSPQNRRHGVCAQCPALQSCCSHIRKIIREILQEHIQTQAVEVAGEERVMLENEVLCFPLILSPHQGLTRLSGFFQSICCQSLSAPIQRHPSVTVSRKTGEGAGYILENIKTTFWNV